MGKDQRLNGLATHSLMLHSVLTLAAKWTGGLQASSRKMVDFSYRRVFVAQDNKFHFCCQKRFAGQCSTSNPRGPWLRGGAPNR
jgi:hypothetical protein